MRLVLLCIVFSAVGCSGASFTGGSGILRDKSDNRNGGTTVEEKSTNSETTETSSNNESDASHADNSSPITNPAVTGNGCVPNPEPHLEGWNIKFFPDNGQLHIDGSNSSNTIKLLKTDNDEANAVALNAPDLSGKWPIYRCIKELILKAGGGNDVVSFEVLQISKVTLYGGEGDDIFTEIDAGIKGGVLNLYGDQGDDTFSLSSYAGHWSGVTVHGD